MFSLVEEERSDVSRPRVIVLLPPSQTKAEGGDGVLVPAELGFPRLRGRRRTAMAALRRVPLTESRRVLKLGPQSMHEATWNRALTTGPTLPAIERYTGVLYDGLGVTTLAPSARVWVDEHVVIASALFGLLRAGDRIPAYRLSGSTPLPGVPLRAHWSESITSALAGTGEWLLDARSSAYVALGPAPVGGAALHVESVDGSGRRRALNHFNKHAKGALVRALAQSAARIDCRDELLDWAHAHDVHLEPRDEHDLTLVV